VTFFFQIDIPKNSDMIETFQCTTLATSRYVVLGPFANSHFMQDFEAFSLVEVYFAVF
jgi:hypothetical protein